MTKIGVALSVLVVLLAGSVYCYAATDVAGVSVSLKPKITIAVVPNSVSFGDMEPNTEKQLDAAGGSYAVGVTVKSNEPWDFDYNATDFASGANQFTINHLAYKLDGAGAYTAFNSTGNLGSGITRGSKTYNYDYKLAFEDTDADWAIPSGDYSSTITYSAAQ